jgi:hypothetical protein
MEPATSTTNRQEINGIKINREIFQGDSIPPPLLGIALIPLTHELNRWKCGY